MCNNSRDNSPNLIMSLILNTSVKSGSVEAQILKTQLFLLIFFQLELLRYFNYKVCSAFETNC